jgi:RNA polymerase sigma-70 factor (ECF subfamily)
VFNLYVIDGFQHNEIAAMLGISESTSKTQLRKAKLALQEKLQDLKPD